MCLSNCNNFQYLDIACGRKQNKILSLTVIKNHECHQKRACHDSKLKDVDVLQKCVRKIYECR